MKRSIRRISLFVLVLVALGGVVYWGTDTKNQFFQLAEPEIVLDVTESELATLQYLKPSLVQLMEQMVGQNIWRVGLEELRARLQQNSWVEDVQIERRFPNQLKVQFGLKGVAFHYNDSKGHLRAVDWSGQTLKELPTQYLPPAPVLANHLYFENSEKREMFVDLLKQVPQIGSLKWKNVASVDFNGITGLALELIDEDVVVYLGDSHLDQKGMQVLRVVDYLKKQQQKARVIDASFDKKVLVRLRKRS